MPVRSHYTSDSQQRRPLTSKGARRERVPEQPREFIHYMPCEACNRCPFKRIADETLDKETPMSQPPTPKQMERDMTRQRGQIVQQYQTSPVQHMNYGMGIEGQQQVPVQQPQMYYQQNPQQYPPQQVPQCLPQPLPQYQQPLPQQPVQPQEPPKKKGLIRRFLEYRERNLAANKAAGDTTLMEDLSKTGGSWMSGISKGAASLGQEEIDNLSRKKARKSSEEEDEELLNFLQGKRKK